MKYIISRYNHDITPILPYIGKDFVMYDRSEVPLENTIVVPNIGTDIMDKFTYIIDNYNNLPDVVCLIKANLFKYITEEEFKLVKDNKTFTPLLTKNHQTEQGISFYSEDGMYNEINNFWYLREHAPRNYGTVEELKTLLRLRGKEYLKFAPGSNYIVPKENILQHSKEDYIKLRSFLEWSIYPGEAQLMERGLYYLWSLM